MTLIDTKSYPADQQLISQTPPVASLVGIVTALGRRIQVDEVVMRYGVAASAGGINAWLFKTASGVATDLISGGPAEDVVSSAKVLVNTAANTNRTFPIKRDTHVLEEGETLWLGFFSDDPPDTLSVPTSMARLFVQARVQTAV